MQPMTRMGKTVSTLTACLVSLCIIAGLNGCKPKDNNNANVQALLSDDATWLKGKRLSSIESIIDEHNCAEILYVFNYYDCMTCIDHGFAAVRLIDSLAGDNTVKVIASMFREITSTQRQNNYKGFIYKDAKDRIRKELRYAPTPMMLILNDSCRIEEAFVFTPPAEENAEKLKAFLQKCVSRAQSVRKY